MHSGSTAGVQAQHNLCADAVDMTFHSDSFDAIGVRNQVIVTDHRELDAAVRIARAGISALDLACSRFRSDSELSQLNAARSARVSELFLALLDAAVNGARVSGGLVDPSVGASMRALGYDQDFGSLCAQPDAADVRGLPAGSWPEIIIDRPSRRVTLPEGCELDLGATAKAFAADLIAAQVHQSLNCAVLVSLGGDIAVAGVGPPAGWPVLVTDDSRAADAEGQVIALSGGGLATSSTTVRRWSVGDRELHHVLDPRSGLPAPAGWRTVTVAAESCLTANVATTAALVLGTDAVTWLRSRRHSARLVSETGTVVVTGDWPADPSISSSSTRPRAQEVTA